MLKLLSPSEAQRLCEFLAQAGYSDEEFRKRLTFREPPSRHAGNIPYLLDSTGEPSALNMLLRLFLFGMALEARAVSGVIPEPVLAIMLESGILAASGGAFEPAVMLTPLDQYWFAADPLARLESEQSSDIVLFPNQTTRILHQSSIRQPSRSTLDLGAGCGVLSVLAAPYSVRVAATDLNPRAAAFTRFNARLNGVENIECYSGDTFEPVREQMFDRILANPPFFITPSSAQLYCENPMDLDGYCRRVVREASGHLNEGGYLQMTLEWVHLRGESWQERVAEWMEETGCDAWILRGYWRDPAAYAYERTKDGYPASPEKATAKFNEYVAYYRAHDIESVCGGMLMARRRTGQNWLRIEDLPLDAPGPFGESVNRVFETQTILSEHPSDEAMLALRPRLAPDTLLQQHLHLADGRWAPESLQLTLQQGLRASLEVESEVAGFLARCNGNRQLGELVQELANTVPASPVEVRQQCSNVVRKLAERRFICFAT